MVSFIKTVAEVAVKDWLERKIMLPSVVIAQAILESSWGKSELATGGANALFGIKKNGWTGRTYIKVATEQRKDGSYYTVDNTEWRAYNSWDESIIDHNTYIATRERSAGVLRYAPIIGNTNYAQACQFLKDCGYATDLNYPNKLINLINEYNLTQYDAVEEAKQTMSKLKIAIDAGHYRYTSGKRCMKSLDANETREWVLNDRIADCLEALLKSYQCEVLRVDDTTGEKDTTLANRCKKANEWGAHVYISIHHNAGVKGGSGGGTVVFWYSSKAERKAQAQALYNEVVALTGLVGNRSSKVVKSAMYVCKNTAMPAFLLENGFMDSSTDVPIILSEEHANKTAQGLVNFLVKEFKLEREAGAVVAPEDDVIYRVQCGAYRNKANAEALKNTLIAKGFKAVVVSGQQK